MTGQRPLPTLRGYYRDALTVALAIVEQRGIVIESPGGAVRLPSLVVNMNYVFEAYIRTVLEIYARAKGWSESVLDGNTSGSKRLFDAGPPLMRRPTL